MKIRRVKISNFLSFGEDGMTIDLSRLNLIVGPNASGKTNFLRTLTYVGNCLRRDGWSRDTEYFHSGASHRSFEIEVALSLTEDETNAIANYIILSMIGDSVTTKEGEDQNFNRRVAFRIALILKEKLRESFKNVSVVVRRRSGERDSPDILLKFTFLDRPFYLDSSGNMMRTNNKEEILGSEHFTRLLIDEVEMLDPKIDLREHIEWRGKHILAEGDYKVDRFLVSITKRIDENRLSATLPTYIRWTEINRADGSVDLITELKEFLLAYGNADESITFFRLLGAIYNGSIIRISELRSRPDPYTILPKNLDTVKDQMTEFDGRDLSKVLFQLKNSVHKIDRSRYLKIRASFKKMTGSSFDVVLRTISSDHPDTVSDRRSFTISVPYYGTEETPSVRPSSDTYRHETAIIIQDNGWGVSLDFSAAGLFEILLLLTVLIGQKRKVLLLDEPASNLHPMKQIELRLRFERSASKSDNQIILVTHSPALVSMDNARNTWRFFKEGRQTRALQLSKQLGKPDIRKTLGGKGSDVKWGEILFANGMVLVEGPGDKYAVERFDSYLKNDGASLQDDNWSVIITEGKGGIPDFMGLGLKLKIGYVVLTDKDGIMQCDKRVNKDGVSIKAPALLAFLIENDILETKDQIRLKSINIVDGSYSDENFAEIQEMVRRYRIFALPTKLEDVLGVKKGSGKVRGVLEAVEEWQKRNVIPSIFMDFFEYLRKEKDR